MDDDLPAKDRFLRLPDDPDQRERAVRTVQRCDPEARVYDFEPPIGSVLKVHNVVAFVAARMMGCQLNAFEIR